MFDSETDWNIVTEPMSSVGDRQVKVSRGRFLGGSSGVNGTLCIRGPHLYAFKLLTMPFRSAAMKARDVMKPV